MTPTYGLTEPQRVGRALSRRAAHRRRRLQGGILSSSRLATTTVVDQCLASGSNFAVGVAVARVAGATGLGVFSVVYAAWLFLSALHRAVITDPMAIDGDARDDDWRERVGCGLAADLLLGLVGTLVFGLTSGVLFALHQRSFGVAFAVLAPFVTFLLLQDYWRWIGFMRRRPGDALLNDVVFNIIQAGMLAAIFITHLHTAAAVILCWGLGAVGGAAYGFWNCRLRPTRRGGWSLLRSRWSYSKWIAINQMLVNGLGQASVVLTGAILGLGGLGGFKAAQALVTGPMGVLIQAGGSMGLPEASRAYASSAWVGLRRVCRVITVASFASVVVFIIVVLIWGRTLLSLIYGPSFAHLQMVSVLIGCGFLLVALGLGPILVLKSTRNTQHLFTVQVVYSAVLLTTIAVFSLAYGITGAAIATIIASATSAAGLRWVQHRVHPMRAPIRAFTSRSLLWPEASPLPESVKPDGSSIRGG